MKRNWEALVLKAFGGRDFHLTVLAAEPGIRLWFDNAGRAHQRAFTLVDPDPAADQFSLEFALHDGCAARWALAAQPGDTIQATVQGSAFRLPEPAPKQLFVVGDAASLPAVNSLFDAAGGIAVTAWLEYAHDEERAFPLRTRPDDRVTWVPRRDGSAIAGRQLVETVAAQLSALGYWSAS